MNAVLGEDNICTGFLQTRVLEKEIRVFIWKNKQERPVDKNTKSKTS